MWTATLRKILTLDSTDGRGMLLVNLCCLCGRNEETGVCLLLHCEVAYILWCLFFDLFGIKQVMSIKVVGIVNLSEGGQFSCHLYVSLCKMVPLCVLWCIWRERNCCSFEDSERSVSELKFYVFIHFVSVDKKHIALLSFVFLIFRAL